MEKAIQKALLETQCPELMRALDQLIDRIYAKAFKRIDRKDEWAEKGSEWLWERLLDEVGELKSGIPGMDIYDEAADVAIFAAMYAESVISDASESEEKWTQKN